ASPTGEVFVSDLLNDVIRKLTPVATGSAALSASPVGLYLRSPGNTQASLDVFLDGVGAFTWNAAAHVTTPSGGNWLSLSQTNGTGNTTVSVTANAAGLTAGSYNGTITISSPQAASG